LNFESAPIGKSEKIACEAVTFWTHTYAHHSIGQYGETINSRPRESLADLSSPLPGGRRHPETTPFAKHPAGFIQLISVNTVTFVPCGEKHCHESQKQDFKNISQEKEHLKNGDNL